jgi:hypothetical protein
MTKSAELAICVVAMVIVAAIVLPFFWLIVWRRKGWARWILLFLFVSVLLPTLDYPHSFDPDEVPLTVLTYLSALVESAAFYFVFTGDARPWFR